MVEKKLCRFSKFWKRNSCYFPKWMTNSRLDVNAEKAKGIFEKSSHHHGRIFLFSGGSTHQWEKSQRVLTFLTQNGSFFRKNFHDREPVEVNVRESKNSCWWKTSVFRSGRYWFFTGQMDSSFPNHRKSEEFLLLPLLSNQRQFLKTMISHMGNYLTKAEKFQFRHSTWDFLIS